MEDLYLAHHGVLGMKWGVRRYQNPDGALTSAGKRRYQSDSVSNISSKKGIKRRLNDIERARAEAIIRKPKADYKASKAQAKNDEERTLRSRDKAIKKNEKAKTYSQALENYSHEKRSLLEAASKNGFGVLDKPVIIITSKQKKQFAAAAAAFGLLGVAVVGNRNTVQGSKYKVYKYKNDAHSNSNHAKESSTEKNMKYHS